jgi:molybdenum cofactor cytidylyltransferase
VVVLGAHADEVRERVPMHGAEPIFCSEWQKGMGNSLRAGIDALRRCDAVVVALGDQPKLSPTAVERLLGQRGNDELAVRATYGGVPGHPVLLERRVLATIRELRGDIGARELLHGVPLREVACDGLGSPADVDTPEALAALSAG